MTKQEATERLKSILDEATEDENSVCYVTAYDEEPLKMAIKSLEKQIPKEPYRISGIDIKYNAMVDCPICKSGNETSIKTIKHIYCWKCGQALKWE